METERILECFQCGRLSDAGARGWHGCLSGDEGGARAVELLCPVCAAVASARQARLSEGLRSTDAE